MFQKVKIKVSSLLSSNKVSSSVVALAKELVKTKLDMLFV